MDVVASLFALAFISLLAAISPGPDFYIVLRNSLSYSRASGLWTALGISLALIIHLTYTLVGIGVLIVEGSTFYSFLKWAGVGYLFYIGSSSIVSSFRTSASLDLRYAKSMNPLTPFKALTQGFLTNLLNPKAVVFFVSLFSQFIDNNTPISLRIEYAFINWSITLCWFLMLSYLITTKKLAEKIDRHRLYIDRIMGGALILLSMRLLAL